jgi:hypothetical protein
MGPWRFFPAVIFVALCCAAASAFGRVSPVAGLTAVAISGICLVLGAKRIMALIDHGIGEIGDDLVELAVESTPAAKGYFWAGLSLDFEEACKHFVTIGATGAGKSVTLNMLMMSVLKKLGKEDARRRMVVYDAKADLVSFITRNVSKGVKVRILNPMDARFAPWNMAADILTEIDAIEFASILIPKNDQESSPYFTNTARALVAGVIKRLIVLLPGKWSLRDVLLAFEDQATLERLLNHSDTRYLMDHFSKANDRNFSGVKSTIDTELSIYRPIAALLHAGLTNPSKFSEEDLGPIDASPFSLKEWIRQANGGVLVLGNHENAREATDTLNRLLFRQLSKLLIAREGRMKDDETWIFLDELREAGMLSGLRQILLRGRSKGIALAMGFQDVQGIYAVYGQHEGAEIIGAAQNIAVLHINASAPETADWASKVFGSRRAKDSSQRHDHDDGGSGSTTQTTVVPNVLPIQFTQLRMPGAEGIKYFAYTNRTRHGVGTYDARFLEQDGAWQKPPANCREVPDFKDHSEREAGRLRLAAWRQGERKALRLIAGDDSTAESKHPMDMPRPDTLGVGGVGQGYPDQTTEHLVQ